MSVVYKEITIAPGANLSSAINISGYRIGAIHMPSSWDKADISFAISAVETGTYAPLYDDANMEVIVRTGDVFPRVIAIDLTAMALSALLWVKVRSGIAISPVNQQAWRTIGLSLASI